MSLSKDLESHNGIIDLLLHAHDVPFTVADIFELAETAGMAVAGMNWV